MDDKRTTLSASEWKVMECLWTGEKTLMELVRELKERAGWAKSTVTTMVRRLEEKGLVTYETRGRTKLFRAALAREDAVADRGSLSRADIDELYAILDKAEEESK